MGLLVMIALFTLLVILFKGILSRKSGVISQIPAAPLTPIPVGIRAVISTIRALGWCLLAPTGVMTIFVVLSGVTSREWSSVFSQQTAPQPVSHTQIPAIDSGKSTEVRATDIEANRPAWIARGDTTVDEVRRIVLSSGLWNTEGEARRELQAKAVAMIRADFENRHHGPFSFAGQNFVNEERVAEIAVKERYLERVEQDFGKFSSPMNRLWWQIEISPVVRTEIYPAWKAGVVHNRIVVVGTVLALLTLLANATSLFSTLTRLHHRPSAFPTAS